MKKQTYWIRLGVRVVVAAYVGLFIFAWAMSDRLIFQPPASSYDESEDYFYWLSEEEGQRVAAFYHPPRSEADGVVLWAHGNAEDAGFTREMARFLVGKGLGVIVYDYPGYGLSEGPPSEAGCYRAAQLAYDFLRNEQGVSPKRIVALGQSLGSGPSTWIAAEKEVAGLVLISPFKSTFQVLTQRQILPFDKFDNLKRMKRVEAPLLLIHGTVDDVVPFAHGETLFAAHLGEKKFVAVEGAGHVDLWSGWQELMVNEVFSFCQQAVSRE